MKKTCADYDLAILCLYGYIPVYTKVNLVYTMCVHIQRQLSYFLFQGSVLLLDHASIHPPCTVQCNLQPKVKKKRVKAIRYVGLVHRCIYQYILHTAQYIQRYTILYLESGSSRLASPFCLGCLLVPCIARGVPLLHSLLDRQASKAGLATPKRPQPRVDFIDIAASSSVQSSSVGTAKWEACFLALAKHVRDSGSRVTSQKQWDKRDPAHHKLGRTHVEAGCRGWFIQLHHPRVLHRPLHRQVKFFKGTEENQGVNNVIRASMAAFVFRQSPILWTQNTCEEELGTGIPTVLQGNIVAILLNAVRKWRDHNNGILHTAMQ